jgi:hypothetical protein
MHCLIDCSLGLFARVDTDPALRCVQLRETIVSNVSGAQLTIVVPQRGIWGTAGIGGKNIDM